MKGLKLFIIITIVTILIVAITFILLYQGWIGDLNNPLSRPDQVQTLTGILGLAIGTAAALGSAIAALKVASLGLEISQQQERRDNISFVESKVEKTIDFFSEIAFVLGKIHASTISMEAKIPHITNEEAEKRMMESAEIDLELEKQQLADDVLLLTNLLEEVLKNEFAAECYFYSLTTFKKKTEFLNENLKRIDTDISKHSIYSVNIDNISDICSLLDIGQRKIRRGNMRELINARLFTNASEMEIFNVPYNNSNVRSFFFLGNLIFNVAEDNLSFITNYGSAILHDIYYSIPNGSIIETVLRERYSNLFTLNKEYKVSFAPNKITSEYFQKALVDADDIGDLYMLLNKS